MCYFLSFIIQPKVIVKAVLRYQVLRMFTNFVCEILLVCIIYLLLNKHKHKYNVTMFSILSIKITCVLNIQIEIVFRASIMFTGCSQFCQIPFHLLEIWSRVIAIILTLTNNLQLTNVVGVFDVATYPIMWG